MAGIFDNESHAYIYDESWDKGEWFTDEAGYLYIAPIGGDIEGPDNETADALLACYRDHGDVTPEDCDRLGIFPISDILKRFNPIDGFYHA